MARIDDLKAALSAEIKALARGEAKSVSKGVSNALGKFLDELEDVEKWLGQLDAGELTRKDFEFLVRAKKDVAEMHLLEVKGLAAARVERLQTAILDAVISCTFKALT